MKQVKARNVTHNQKKLNEDELREFRSGFGIPISDAEMATARFYKPQKLALEMKYLRERRKAYRRRRVPSRPTVVPTMQVPTLADYARR